MQHLHFDIDAKPFHAIASGDPDAPLALFLHGFPEHCGAWNDVLPLLQKDYFCVAPDQRGYGRSWRQGSVTDYSTKYLAGDVLQMIDLFGNGTASALIGHDWGASVAYACAMRAPEKIDNLVIINGVHPAPFQKELAAGAEQSKSSQYIEWLRKEGSEKILAKDNFDLMFDLFSKHMNMEWLTEQKKAEYKNAWRDEEGVRGMVNWYRATPLLVAKPDHPIPEAQLPKWDKNALKITMPHLLLWGMADTALQPVTRDGLADYCDDLTVAEREDADHWIIHQHPEWVADQILSFLNRP